MLPAKVYILYSDKSVYHVDATEGTEDSESTPAYDTNVVVIIATSGRQEVVEEAPPEDSGSSEPEYTYNPQVFEMALQNCLETLAGNLPASNYTNRLVNELEPLQELTVSSAENIGDEWNENCDKTKNTVVKQCEVINHEVKNLYFHNGENWVQLDTAYNEEASELEIRRLFRTKYDISITYIGQAATYVQENDEAILPETAVIWSDESTTINLLLPTGYGIGSVNAVNANCAVEFGGEGNGCVLTVSNATSDVKLFVEIGSEE